MWGAFKETGEFLHKLSTECHLPSVPFLRTTLPDSGCAASRVLESQKSTHLAMAWSHPDTSKPFQLCDFIRRSQPNRVFLRNTSITGFCGVRRNLILPLH